MTADECHDIGVEVTAEKPTHCSPVIATRIPRNPHQPIPSFGYPDLPPALAGHRQYAPVVGAARRPVRNAAGVLGFLGLQQHPIARRTTRYSALGNAVESDRLIAQVNPSSGPSQLNSHWLSDLGLSPSSCSSVGSSPIGVSDRVGSLCRVGFDTSGRVRHNGSDPLIWSARQPYRRTLADATLYTAHVRH